MRKTILNSVLIVFLLASGVNCSKSSNGPKSCDFQLVDSQPLSSNSQVIYLAGVENAGGTISSLSYLDSTGTITVMNPMLPWSKTVTLKAGLKPTIGAKGSANKGGQINISFVSGGIQSGQSCEN